MMTREERITTWAFGLCFALVFGLLARAQTIGTGGGGAGTPGGSSTQFQYNNAAAFGGAAGFTWDNVNQIATLAPAAFTASQSALSITPTWNNAGVAFPGALLVNATNSASTAASLLLDLQIGGTTEFNVNRGGNVTALGGVTANTFSTATGQYLQFGNRVYIDSPADAQFRINNNAGTRAAILPGGTAVPTLSGCGTSPSIDAASTSLAGEVTEGTTATGCVITFVPVLSNKPFCIVTSQSQLVSFAYTTSTSAITVVNTSASGDIIDYHCIIH
jgi:hypothetical protein